VNRDELISRVRDRRKPWDLAIIGGGATGVGIATDAAARGYDVVLFEQHDFGKGTSSRSTKLVHGGVRYLEQGNLSLVMEALKERGILRENAPHLVSDLAFIVPNYEWWEAPFYGLGLRVYDLLAGKYGFGPSRNLSREEVLERLPTLKTDGLRGGVVYYDGQFDDSRLLINLAATAVKQGATLVNYCRVSALRHNAAGFLNGLATKDEETGEEFLVDAKAVISATGPFSDSIRRMTEPSAPPMIAPSQGIHLVFDSSFLPGDSAIMVPHTSDGRVMFAIPWHGHTLVGTTDTPVAEPLLEPTPLDEEIDFILETAGEYLAHPPRRADVLSTFAGIRPLVRAVAGASTASLSRDHSVHIEKSGLLTIVGGKWTTYRKMAEDCVDQAATLAFLDERECVTRHLRVHGYHQNAEKFGHLGVYGSDAVAIRDLVRVTGGWGQVLHPALPYIEAEVIWAVRQEMARTVEDVLARRTRALFLNSRAALEMAPRVAALMAGEFGFTDAWIARQLAAFSQVAAHYRV
jgi:glycerol-3-phosphate dehydrogenase